MKTFEKFENGLSIVQLEERYEMAAAGDREKTKPGDDMKLPDMDPYPGLSL